MSNFIKDSSDNYTLYVNQGIDFEISIPLISYNIQNLINVNFIGSIKKHTSSRTFQEIVLEKNTETNSLVVKIPSEISLYLKDYKYSFDIIYSDGLTTKLLISGDVIIKETMSRL